MNEILLISINLVLGSAWLLFAFRRIQHRLMRKRGKDYNARYKQEFNLRGRKKDLPVPRLQFVDAGSKLSWPYPWLQRVWRRHILVIRTAGRTHGIALLVHIGLTSYLHGFEFADMGLYLFLGVLLFGLVLLLTRFTPRIGLWFRSASWLLTGSLWLLLLAFLGSGLAILEEGELMRWLPLLAYLLVWTPLLPRLFRRGDTDLPSGGMNLLILRVFGSMRRSYFSFNVLQPLWNFVGSVMTVSSPDEHPFPIRRLRRLHVVILFLLWLSAIAGQLWVSQEISLGWAWWPVAIAMCVLTCALLFFPLRWAVRSLFLKDEHQAYETMIKRITARNGMRVYANIRISCYQDDWHLAVDAFAGFADAVLIDLRGFTRANAGIAYELGYVLNKAPLENVLGLVDRTTDVAAVREVFADHWQHLSRQSPNYGKTRQRFRIYRVKRLRSRDVFPLSAWLLSGSIRDDLLDLSEEARQKLLEDTRPGGLRRFFSRLGSGKRKKKPAASGTRKEKVPLHTWDRKQGAAAWMYLTWLPAGHKGFPKCPHGRIKNWQQLPDPSIRRPFTIKTQALGPREDESAFWKKMAKEVERYNKVNSG